MPRAWKGPGADDPQLPITTPFSDNVKRMLKTIRFAVISDLHYRKDNDGVAYRPAAGAQGAHADPVEKLIAFLEDRRSDFNSPGGKLADYLLCPGDICDKADGSAFNEGWRQLKKLQKVLRADHLIASTGNHEVHSRPSDLDKISGYAEAALDPLEAVQEHGDYPTELLCEERRWVYWGRGYEIIEREEVLLLLINSSHFHPTTQPNEYERGRIGKVALALLRAELKTKVESNRNRLFITLLHHHPVAHEDLAIELGRIQMHNGELLMQVLAECGVAWIVVHGHKHFPRLILSADSGDGQSVVLAAGSAGVELKGEWATKTSHQFYIVELDVVSQEAERSACGRIRALSWQGDDWKFNELKLRGLPDRCGFRIPTQDLNTIVASISTVLAGANEYMTWQELVSQIPALCTLLPQRLAALRRALKIAGIQTTWLDTHYFPTDVSR